MTFVPPPVQQPRIPIWVVGAWPRPKSLRRALQWDGILPTKMLEEGSFADMTPADIQELKTFGGILLIILWVSYCKSARMFNQKAHQFGI